MKPISQQLADLSLRAKTAEERIAAAQVEARGALDARRETVEKDVRSALDGVRQSYEQAKEETKSRFAALQTKVSSDIRSFKDRVEQGRQAFKIRGATNYAEDMAVEAAMAIDYAAAAVTIAELAALDAIAARAEGEPHVIAATLTPA